MKGPVVIEKTGSYPGDGGGAGQGKFMNFKKMYICVFKRIPCGQQLEARIAVKSLWWPFRLEVMMAWGSSTVHQQ